MTIYRSPLVLGQKYRDDRTGIEGHCTMVVFNENGCVEACLEWAEKNSNDGIEKKTEFFNELRIKPTEDSTVVDVEYASDIELSVKYRDIQTGLEGHAAVVEFHEHMATRVAIRSVGYDKDGSKKLIYHSIDDFLLENQETKKVAQPKNDKRSPVTREIAQR